MDAPNSKTTRLAGQREMLPAYLNVRFAHEPAPLYDGTRRYAVKRAAAATGTVTVNSDKTRGKVTLTPEIEEQIARMLSGDASDVCKAVRNWVEVTTEAIRDADGREMRDAEGKVRVQSPLTNDAYREICVRLHWDSEAAQRLYPPDPNTGRDAFPWETWFKLICGLSRPYEKDFDELCDEWEEVFEENDDDLDAAKWEYRPRLSEHDALRWLGPEPPPSSRATTTDYLFTAFAWAIASIEFADQYDERSALEWRALPNPVMDTLMDDLRFAWVACGPRRESTSNYPMFNSRVRGDEELAIAVVAKNGYHLRSVTGPLQNKKAVVIAAITGLQPYGAMRFASARLRDDADVVITALGGSKTSFEFAGPKARSSLRVLRAVARREQRQLRFASREGLLKVLARAGGFLEFARENTRDDSEVVLRAVQTTPMALQFASDRLKNTPMIVSAAVSRDGLALQHASVGLRANVDIVMKAIQNNAMAIQYSRVVEARSRLVVARAAVAKDPRALRFVSKPMIMHLIREGGDLLATMSQALQSIHAERGRRVDDHDNDYGLPPVDRSVPNKQMQRTRFITDHGPVGESNRLEDMEDDALMASSQ